MFIYFPVYSKVVCSMVSSLKREEKGVEVYLRLCLFISFLTMQSGVLFKRGLDIKRSVKSKE